jgi:hypothetical protein
MYPKKLRDVDQGVRARVAVERRIVKRTVKDLLEAGYTLSVFDGEEESAMTSTDYKLLHDALLNTDQDFLNVWVNGKRFGWVRFVYGNDGYDVISDYTVNLEDALKGVNEFASSLE